MNTTLLLMIWLLPLSLTTLARQRHAQWLLPLAAIPALLAVTLVPVGTRVSLPWLLLGGELGIDATSQVFLAFSGLLWLVAAVYIAGSQNATAASGRFRVFFLMAMAGNLGLIVAQDMVSFYFGFALMGLSACGLVAQASSRRARRAARTCLIWTIAGELLLFTAMISLAASGAGALTFDALQTIPRSTLTVTLLIAGFGIKLALPLLHWWLPPVYAVTPVAVVALFSGVMIKAGLLGWLRFLPPGDTTPAGWGMLLILIGTAAIAFGVIAGLVQRRPRLLLGYSSISKMGILTSGVGTALMLPSVAPGIIAALLVYAIHHALVKTALFLGLGLVEHGGLRLPLLMGLGFLALALAGAPLTSGALAKSALGASLPQSTATLVTLLAASTVATTLLMARLMYLLWIRRRRATRALPATPVAAWLCLVALIISLPFLLTGFGQSTTNTGPVALGLLLAPLVIPIASRTSARFTGLRKRTRIQARGSHLRTTSGGAPLARHFVSGLGAIAGKRPFAAARRIAGNLRVRLQQYGGCARHPLTGALWLAIAGGLLGTFAAAT